MGEIADMMLDGTLCQECRVSMGRGLAGYPRSCRACQRSHDQPRSYRLAVCPTCGRRVKFVGLKDHMSDAHGVKP